MGDVEIVSFDFRYALARRAFGGMVVASKGADDLAAYGHAVYFCVLPAAVPQFTLWSRSRTWDVPWVEDIIGGDVLEVEPAFDDAFRLQGPPGAEAVFDAELRAFLLQNPSWNAEVSGDALLAFQIPARMGMSYSVRAAEGVADPDKAVFWELVTHLQRAAASARG